MGIVGRAGGAGGLGREGDREASEKRGGVAQALTRNSPRPIADRGILGKSRERQESEGVGKAGILGRAERAGEGNRRIRQSLIRSPSIQ